MKSKYMMGLMCAFCFGVLGKTALDTVGFELVAEAKADLRGVGYQELRKDRNFRRAVEAIAYDTAADVVSYMARDIVRADVPNIVEKYCSVYVDGDYGSLSCR